jgi:hypothetical protein
MKKLKCSVFVTLLALAVCGCVQFGPVPVYDGYAVQGTQTRQVLVVNAPLHVVLSETHVLPLVPVPGLTWIPGNWVWHSYRGVPENPYCGRYGFTYPWGCGYYNYAPSYYVHGQPRW